MHASMAIFNAWCDRGADASFSRADPWDAAKRRPWIDWIHTASDQAALVRDFTKWDNQPASVPGGVRGDPARRAGRQHRAARAYLCEPRRRLAEAKIGRASAAFPDAKRYRAPDRCCRPGTSSRRRRSFSAGAQASG